MSKRLSKRLGIFGGSFNPFHRGHLNSLLQVQDNLSLDKVFLVPSYQTPGKPLITHPSPEHRLHMTQLGVADYEDIFEVSSLEIERGGLSYTIETVKKLKKQFPQSELFLIVGADAFTQFDTWKDFQDLLSLVHLVITSRPGYVLPIAVEDLPSGVQPLVDSVGAHGFDLKNGHQVHYVRLKDIDVSGTEVRRALKSGLRVDRYLPISVEKFIRENSLYQGLRQTNFDDKKMAEFCYARLIDKKSFNIRLFNITPIQGPFDYAIVASGTSTKHTASLGEILMQEVKEEFGVYPQSIEGLIEGRWVLLDYGSVVVHIFYDFLRAEYKIEELWKDGQEIRPHAGSLGIGLER